MSCLFFFNVMEVGRGRVMASALTAFHQKRHKSASLKKIGGKTAYYELS